MESKRRISFYIGLGVILSLVFSMVFEKTSFLGMVYEVTNKPFVIQGQKSISSLSQKLPEGILSKKRSLVINYDLNGLCLLGGQSSHIVLVAEDGKRYSVSLSKYGQNCALYSQEVRIPISDFKIDQPLEKIISLETNFWYPTSYNVEVRRITAYRGVADILHSAAKNLFAAFSFNFSGRPLAIDISRVSPSTIPTPAIPSPVPTISPTIGYYGEYWNTPGQFSNPKFPTSTPNFTRTDSAINFNWNFGSPDASIQNEHFVARWQKNAVFETGTYKFTVTTDDGVRIFLDDVLILDQWKDQPSTYYKVNKAVTEGVHQIKVEYYENAGGAVIRFDYQKTGSAQGSVQIVPTPTPTPTPVIIPTPKATPTPTPTIIPTPIPTPLPTPTAIVTAGYSGEYWNTPGQFSAPQFPTTAPNFTRTDPSINFVWNDASPASLVTIDHFVVRWTRYANFNSGTHRFTVVSDDGVRVYLDGKIIIDAWKDQGSLSYSSDVVLASGTHQIKVEYYENAGGAVMKFDYQQVSLLATPIPTPTPTPTPIIPTPTPTPTPIPTPTPTPISIPTPTPIATPIIATPNPVPSTGSSWSIRSVSSMKETKDKICGQDSASFINSWLDRAVELGVNYVAVETPYDNPTCGSSVNYTKMWVDAVHARGLNVWHRHAPLAFEGIYDTQKNASADFLSLIANYIIANPSFFRAGDIFTPVPEPQNGGISGITYCPQNICIFSGAASFNKWLRDAMVISESAFSEIGLGGKMKIGYYGFDGFVAWGDNNPDWHGILEDATVRMMGNITIDHYPEIVGDTMENDLNELQSRYPNVPIVIGEWGTITGGDIASQVLKSMQAALRPNVIGFNYWHMGMGGNEAMVNSDFTKRANFDPVKSFFLK